MKAAQYSKYGGPDVIEVVDIDVPEISPNQVLVENFAASINPFDFKVRNGWIKGLPKNFPITIGGDFSGKIKSVDSAVSNFSEGDDVFGQASVFGGSSGSMAEFVAVNIDTISKKPEELNYLESASLPLVGCSAVQSLHDHMNIQKGQTIFINGGSGGIGSLAIQIAKHIGANVITTVSTENIDFAKELGADIVIDYKTQKFWTSISDVDYVFDVSGKSVDENLYKILKKGGIIVSMNDVSYEFANKYEVMAVAQNSQVNTSRLEKVAQYIKNEIIKPEIEKEFELNDIREAYDYQENKKVRGKVVIKI